MTSKGGYVYRLAYVSETLARERSWEAVQLRNQPRICPSEKKTILRRDIRWYAPTSVGGERCAAIIYVYRCDGETPDLAALEHDRAHLVGLLPDKPIAPACGRVAERDTRLYAQAPFNGEPVTIAPNIRCDDADESSLEPLNIWPSTTIGLRTVMDEQLYERRPFSYDIVLLARIPQQVVGPSVVRSRGQVVQFLKSGTAPRDGASIQLTQTFGLADRPDEYCIELRAQQAGRTWTKHIRLARSGADKAPASTANPGDSHAADRMAQEDNLRRETRLLSESLARSLQIHPVR